MRTGNTNTIAANALSTGLKPVVRVSVNWGGAVGTRYYSNVSNDGAYSSKLIAFSGMQYNVRRNAFGGTGRVTFTLDDDDGQLQTAYQSGSILNGKVDVRIYYSGLANTNGPVFFEGVIIDPINYDEGQRTLSITAEPRIISNQVGFSTQEGQFGVNNDVAIGKFWPIVFGTPAHVPAVLVQREPNSELKYQFTMGEQSGTFYKLFQGSDGYEKLSLEDRRKVASIFVDGIATSLIPNKIYIQDGSGFTQDETIDINIKGVIFRGTMSGDVFTIEEPNVAKYTNVQFAERDATDVDFNNPQVAWLSDSTQSLENAYCWFKKDGNPSIEFRTKVGRNDTDIIPIILKCVRQNGNKIWLEKPILRRRWSKVFEPAESYALLDPTYQINEVRGLNLSGMRISLTDAFDFLAGMQAYRSRRRKDTENKPYGQLLKYLEEAKYIRDIFFSAEPGERVRQWDDLADIYIANAVSSDSIKSVYGIREVDGEDRFIPIPKEYYTVELSKSTSALAQSVGAPPNVTTIEFNQPLSTYKDQGWKDEIYVTVVSSLSSNTATQIKWLLDQYTNFSTDTSSFNNGASALSNKPSHFALLAKQDAIQLAESMAWQCGSGLVYDNNTVKFVVLQTLGSSQATLDLTNTLFKSVSMTTTPSTEVITSCTGRYQVSYKPKLERDERGPEREYVYENNTNIYGYRTQDFDFFIYNNQASVANTLNFWGYRLSNVWKVLSLSAFHDQQLLELFDRVTYSYSSLGLGNAYGLVHGYNFNPTTGLLNLNLWTPINTNSNSIDSNAWQSILSSTPTNPAASLEEYDYDIRLPQDEKDFENWLERVKELRKLTKRKARIKRVDVDGYSDQVVVDIHEDGEAAPGSDDETIEPTVGDAPAYNPNPDFDPVIGEEVEVQEDENGTLMIVGPAPRSLVRVKVVEEFDDYLQCKVADKLDFEGEDVIIYVAKPWDLRKKPFDGETFTIEDVEYTYTYGDPYIIGERLSTDEDDGEEVQRITPPYYVDSELIIERLGVDLVNCSPEDLADETVKPLVWQDTNNSHRQWAEYTG